MCWLLRCLLGIHLAAKSRLAKSLLLQNPTHAHTDAPARCLHVMLQAKQHAWFKDNWSFPHVPVHELLINVIPIVF